MFWRKKKIVAAPVEVSSAGTGTTAMGTGPAAAAPAAAVVAKTEEKRAGKLPGPKPIPEILGNHLVKKMDKESNWAWRLAAVMRPRAGGQKGFDVRIFADYEATASSVKIKDYTTLDQYPKLVLFEGWFDKESKKVELEEKRAMPKVTIYTEKEIQQQIEALTGPESKALFYLAASPASGGPLGRGAALIKINPNYPGKGQKKYIMTAVSMNDMEVSEKGIRMIDSDNPKYIARWIKERHFKASSG